MREQLTPEERRGLSEEGQIVYALTQQNADLRSQVAQKQQLLTEAEIVIIDLRRESAILKRNAGDIAIAEKLNDSLRATLSKIKAENDRLKSEATHWQNSYEGACDSLKIYLLIEKDHQIKTEELKRLREACSESLQLLGDIQKHGHLGIYSCPCSRCLRLSIELITAALKPA